MAWHGMAWHGVAWDDKDQGVKRASSEDGDIVRNSPQIIPERIASHGVKKQRHVY